MNNTNIENFFKEYSSSYAKNDISSICSLCSFPFCFYTSIGTAATVNEADFSTNFGHLVALYNKLGMQSSEAEMISATQLNDTMNLVEIKWHFFKEEKEIIAFSTKYILSDLDGVLKMLAAIEMDEYEQVSKLKKSQSNGE